MRAEGRSVEGLAAWVENEGPAGPEQPHEEHLAYLMDLRKTRSNEQS